MVNSNYFQQQGLRFIIPLGPLLTKRYIKLQPFYSNWDGMMSSLPDNLKNLSQQITAFISEHLVTQAVSNKIVNETFTPQTHEYHQFSVEMHCLLAAFAILHYEEYLLDEYPQDLQSKLRSYLTESASHLLKPAAITALLHDFGKYLEARRPIDGTKPWQKNEKLPKISLPQIDSSLDHEQHLFKVLEGSQEHSQPFNSKELAPEVSELFAAYVIINDSLIELSKGISSPQLVSDAIMKLKAFTKPICIWSILIMQADNLAQGIPAAMVEDGQSLEVQAANAERYQKQRELYHEFLITLLQNRL